MIVAPSSEGKTYLVKNSIDMMPSDDIIMLRSASPKSFLHDYGCLAVRNTDSANPEGDYSTEIRAYDTNQVMPVEDYLVYLREKGKKGGAGSDPRAKEELRALRQRLVTLIRFGGKILVFLEPPAKELWNNLLSVLSHDSYCSVAKFAEGGGSSGKIVTKTVVFEGWPAVVYCTSRADAQSWADLSTRFEAIEPTQTSLKYRNAIKLSLRRMFGRIQNDTEMERQLKEEVMDLTYAIAHGECQVDLPFPPDSLADLLVGSEPTQGLLMRRINQIAAHLALEVLWNYDSRIKWTDGQRIHVLAEAADVVRLGTLYDDLDLMAEANGVRPTLMEFFLKVVCPTFEQKAKNNEIVTSTDIRLTADLYGQNNKTKVKAHRVAVSRYLKELEAVGWLEIEKHPSRPGMPLGVSLKVEPADLASVTRGVTQAVTELFSRPNLEHYLPNLWRGVTVVPEKIIGKNADGKILDDNFYLCFIPDKHTTTEIIDKICKVDNVTPTVTPTVTPQNNSTDNHDIDSLGTTVTPPTSTASLGLNTTFQRSVGALPSNGAASSGQPASLIQQPASSNIKPKRVDLGNTEGICPVCGCTTPELYVIGGGWKCKPCLDAAREGI